MSEYEAVIFLAGFIAMTIAGLGSQWQAFFFLLIVWFTGGSWSSLSYGFLVFVAGQFSSGFFRAANVSGR